MGLWARYSTGCLSFPICTMGMRMSFPYWTMKIEAFHENLLVTTPSTGCFVIVTPDLQVTELMLRK